MASTDFRKTLWTSPKPTSSVESDNSTVVAAAPTAAVALAAAQSMDSLRTEHNGQDASLELVIDTDAGSSTTSIKLTLAEDGLHIAHPSPPARPSTRRFEYLHVVNAAIYTTNSKVVVEIYIVDFNARAAPDGLTKIKGLVQNGYSHTADVWVKHLLDRAYVTERKGHCTEIARDLDIGKYDALVLQSGDGLVYEAVNGFCSRLDALVALQNCPLGIIPAGSGNSASCSINGPDMGNNVLMSALTVIKGLPLPADICSITQGERRSFSILSQAYGLMADVDLGTEHLR
ncbi:sphinganine kinase lcb4 [Cystobasidiomycetes sp. EMM_F5]